MPGPQRARPAGPEQHYPRSQPAPGQNFDFSPLLFWKSLIGRFYWKELKAMGRKEGRREGEREGEKEGGTEGRREGGRREGGRQNRTGSADAIMEAILRRI